MNSDWEGSWFSGRKNLTRCSFIVTALFVTRFLDENIKLATFLRIPTLFFFHCVLKVRLQEIRETFEKIGTTQGRVPEIKPAGTLKKDGSLK